MGRLFLFNPDCEMAIADGSVHYTPPSNIVRMMEDLSILPLWMAEEGDVVYARNGYSPAFPAAWRENLGLKAEIVHDPLSGNYIPAPWGWSPKTARWFDRRGMAGEWEAGQKSWYSRERTVEVIRLLKSRIPDLRGVEPAEPCFGLDRIAASLGPEGRVAKAPWSSSGKGILFLKDKLMPKEREWLGGLLKRQGFLMLERRLDRLQDFAMEFEASGGKVKFMGWSIFETGVTGEYLGNVLASQDELEERLAGMAGRGILEMLRQEMPSVLGKVFPDYCGMLGVDMMIFRGSGAKPEVHPCIEVNLRYNMGILAQMFSRNYLAQGSRGHFLIRHFAGPGEALREHASMQEAYPARYKNNRICSGYLNLVPVTEATRFVASVLCY